MPNTQRLTVGELNARLAELHEQMTKTPLWQREGQRYLDMARERQRLLGMREALLRLEQLQRS